MREKTLFKRFGVEVLILDWRSWALEANSRDDERKGYLRIQLSKLWISIPLANWLVPPHVRRVKAGWDAATVAHMGRDWYDQIEKRIYGFYVSDGHLHVSFGLRVGDSSVDQDWGCFLPWANWRFLRTSYYGLEGEHLRTFAASERGSGFDGFVDEHEYEKSVPKRRFALTDYDGKQIVATTHIEEREWRFGTSWCAWLSVFRRPKIIRSLDIEFDEETGPEKGSWKGGTLGTSIDMLPGELHEEAMRRYCEQEHRSKYRNYRMSFVGQVA